MKEWLDCCMDVCSSYKYGNDIGVERISYQSKIFSVNIRISLIIKGESETCPIDEIVIIILSLKFIDWLSLLNFGTAYRQSTLVFCIAPKADGIFLLLGFFLKLLEKNGEGNLTQRVQRYR